MNFKKAKIASAMLSGLMCAMVMAAPTSKFQESQLSASAWWTQNKFVAGDFYVYLDKLGTNATECSIVGWASDEEMPSNLIIPDTLTVTGKDYNNKEFTVENIKVTAIGMSAFNNSKSLRSVTFPDTIESIGTDAFKNSGLESLEIPSSVNVVQNSAFDNCDSLSNVTYMGTGTLFRGFTNCDNFAYFNGNPLVYYESETGKPCLNPDIENDVYSHFVAMDDCIFLQNYIQDFVQYIIKTTISENDSDVVKARKLHDWVVQQVYYDYDCEKRNLGALDPCHYAWSIFLNKKADGKFYSVCDGYAGGYRILLETAGIESKIISGVPTPEYDKEPGSIAHAWNLVEIAGRKYHIDTCWDDNPKNELSYDNFLKSEYEFKASHKNYIWESTGITGLSTTDIGDVNLDGLRDTEDLERIKAYVEKPKTLSNMELNGADVNMDGQVDMNDHDLLSAYLNRDERFYPSSVTVFEYAFIYDRLGDVNADNKINQDDLNLLSDYLLGKAKLETSLQSFNADMYIDGIIDVFDLIRMRQKIVTIITQPQDASAQIGSLVSTSVEATGEGLTYQWYEQAPGQTGFSESSSTSATYSFLMTEAKDGSKVYCIIKDKHGNAVQSDTVTLGTTINTNQTQSATETTTTKITETTKAVETTQTTKTTTTKATETTKTTKATTTKNVETTKKTDVTTTKTTETTPAPTDPDVTLYGDVNNDGVVNILDVLTLNKNLLSGEELTPQGRINADVDCDGTPTVVDSLNILKFTINLVKSFPII